jgi:hypothetical protein
MCLLASRDLQSRSLSEYVRVEGADQFGHPTGQSFASIGSILHQNGIGTTRFTVDAGSEDVMNTILRSMPASLGILHIDSLTKRSENDFAIVKGSLTHLMPRLVDGGLG